MSKPIGLLSESLGVYSVRIQRHFHSAAGWYLGHGVGRLALAYYALIRAALRSGPRTSGCLAHCRDCGIFFPTHARNRRRRDLRCPFGCRQTHARRSSTQRSVEYYRTKEGKSKKSRHNSRLGQQRKPAGAAPMGKPAGKTAAPGRYDPEMLGHIRMVISLIERRRVSCQEILAMLRRAEKRQRGMGGGQEDAYYVRGLRRDPS